MGGLLLDMLASPGSQFDGSGDFTNEQERAITALAGRDDFGTANASRVQLL